VFPQLGVSPVWRISHFEFGATTGTQRAHHPIMLPFEHPRGPQGKFYFPPQGGAPFNILGGPQMGKTRKNKSGRPSWSTKGDKHTTEVFLRPKEEHPRYFLCGFPPDSTIIFSARKKGALGGQTTQGGQDRRDFLPVGTRRQWGRHTF